MKRPGGHRLSIRQWVVATLILSMLIMMGTTVADIEYSVRQLQKETAAQYLSILRMQVSSLDTTLGNAAAGLLNYKMTGKHMGALMKCADQSEAYFAVTDVTSDLTSYILLSTKAEVIYVRKLAPGIDRSGIAVSSSSAMSKEEKLALEQYVHTMDIASAGTDYTWKPCRIGDEWYFIYNIAGRDYAIGQAIHVKTIVDLFELNLGENNGIAILSSDGADMVDPAPLTGRLLPGPKGPLIQIFAERPAQS